VTRICRLPLPGALLALGLTAQAEPTAISFDTTPSAGQHQRQLIDLQAVMRMRVEAGPDATDEQRAKIAKAAERMGQMGSMKMAMQMEQTLEVGAADASGWLPLTVTVADKGGNVEMGGKTMPQPRPRAGNMSFSARFNPRDFDFEMQKLEGGSPELNAAVKQQATTMIGETLQLHKALSQRPLKVGESVEVPFSMPVPMPSGAGQMQSALRYTLVRVTQGVAHFDLSMDLKMDLNAPLPQPAASAGGTDAAGTPPRMLQMVATGRGKGTSSLRLADRLPLASRLAMNMEMTMNAPDNGLMRIAMDMVMQSKGESLAGPAARNKP